uniref:GtrA family protein n=1 Tax=uncultured Clostridium sp. TaxID=59620 RepID=UPI0026124692
YICNSKWVFKYKGERRNETIIKFIVLNLIGLVLNTSILYLLVDKLLFNKLIALIITTLIVMVINYIVNKIWVFK